MKLKIGRIPYANLFPIFHVLERDRDCSDYEFVEEVPARLNRLVREGTVDVSPSSSIEYLKNPSLYNIIYGHSISSSGPIGSIFLFSGVPIEDLDGARISVSSQSESSVGLLDVILRKFYGSNCTLSVSDRPEACDKAFLLIGDDALKYKKDQDCMGAGKPVSAPRRYVYDLGEIWFERTGLPFVFALWIVRKDCPEGDLLKRFEKDLGAARDKATAGFSSIAEHSPMSAYMTKEEIVQYWYRIEYGLDERHVKGLELFGKLLGESGLL
jgi:chorismate dehydratase